MAIIVKDFLIVQAISAKILRIPKQHILGPEDIPTVHTLIIKYQKQEMMEPTNLESKEEWSGSGQASLGIMKIQKEYVNVTYGIKLV